MTATVRRLPVTDARVRGFRLTVIPAVSALDSYSIRLEETYSDRLASVVATSPSVQVRRVLDAITGAVRTAGHAPSILSAHAERTIDLDEASGVRLALVLLATQPMTRSDRVRTVTAGISSMSVEETYYWYSACVGPHASRARKALRILMAGE